MAKKISFLFICLMAFALGYSINNIAISDTAPKVAVVDVQQLVEPGAKGGAVLRGHGQRQQREIDGNPSRVGTGKGFETHSINS